MMDIHADRQTPVVDLEIQRAIVNGEEVDPVTFVAKMDKLGQISLVDFLGRINDEYINLMVHIEALDDWETEVFDDNLRCEKAMESLRESRNSIGTLVEEFELEGYLQ